MAWRGAVVVRRTGPTNIVLRKLIRKLKKAANEHNAPIWDYVAELLGRPARKRVVVNVSRINRYAEVGETVIVPGKVLGAGTLEKPVNVAAFSFSFSAAEKIKQAGGRVMSIEDLLKENPKGSGVRVIA